MDSPSQCLWSFNVKPLSKLQHNSYECHAVECSQLLNSTLRLQLNNGKANDRWERHASSRSTTRTLLNCFVVTAAVELTPVTMITVVRQHQLQLTSSPTHVTPTMPLSTHKQISSFSSHLSLSYFGQAFIFLSPLIQLTHSSSSVLEKLRNETILSAVVRIQLPK